jgi:hypothetical protein
VDKKDLTLQVCNKVFGSEIAPKSLPKLFNMAATALHSRIRFMQAISCL